jgi:hypothetical protein
MTRCIEAVAGLFLYPSLSTLLTSENDLRIMGRAAAP